MAGQDDIQKLITKHQRRLQKLKERQAVQGISTPPEVLIEIEDIEAKLKQLQTELETEQARLRQTQTNLTDMADQGLPVAEALGQVQQQLAAIEQHMAALRAGPTVVDRRSQRVDTQYNVAGNLVQQAASPPVAAPTELRRAYLHRLMQQTRRLPLAGVDPKAASDEDSRELQLAAVYTALLTHRPIERELNLHPRETFPQRLIETMDEVRRLSAVAALNREPCLALLGDPGSGKSTFVNFVGLCLAGETLGDEQANLAVLTAPLPVEHERQTDEEPQPQPWDHGPLLPVRIVLRDLAARGLPEPPQPVGGDTLWAFIKAELGETLGEYAPHFKKELQEKGGLILLDGLDEVPDAHWRRVQVKQAVQGFAADFPRCRFLVTSRTYAYQRQDWKLDGFVEVVLSPFMPGQIVRFVDGWYAHISQIRDLNPEDAQGRATLLKTAIERSKRLSELATRPLLLTLMASLHAWRGGSLPEKREELYHDAVELLLDQWESPKVVRDAAGQPLLRQPSLAEWLKVDKDVVRTELNRLAFEAHRDQPQLVGTADVAQERLVSAFMGVTDNPQVNPVQLVTYIRDRAGLLAARGEGVYTFPHRTFQEYLAACHLTNETFPEPIADLARQEPNRWREVALLAGAKAFRGSRSTIWALVEGLCYQDGPNQPPADEPEVWGAHIAGQALVEVTDVKNVHAAHQPKVERVKRWLVYILENAALPATERAIAGQSLAVLGDPRPGVGLRADGLPDIAWCEIPAGSFLMGDDKQEALPAYKISRYPVTNAQFWAFVEDQGYQEAGYWAEAIEKGEWSEGQYKGCYDPEARIEPVGFGLPFNLANHPVVGITWYEAMAFCRWLSARLGEQVTLPSESQWEKAARGTDGRIYPWGDEADPNRANYDDTRLGSTSAVGCFPNGESPYHCLDMSGNVWEWCADWYDEKKKTRRVVRGGSWHSDGSGVRCALRRSNLPDDHGIGFRVVVSRGPG